jgi:solute carrier family 35 protein F1/2
VVFLSPGSNPVLGDLLCLAGSLLYAISNVAQEFLVKNHGVTEYLGFIGVTGSIASAIQL